VTATVTSGTFSL